MASYLKLSPLLKEFVRGAYSPYIIAAEELASSINVNKRIKGIQIRDHEMRISNFADIITIFLRDIACLNRIKEILKLYKDA